MKFPNYSVFHPFFKIGTIPFPFILTLFFLLSIISSEKDFNLNAARLSISFVYLIIEKTKILPSKDIINLLFNLSIVLTFTFQKELEIIECVFLTLLQNAHLKKYKFKKWAIFSELIFCMILYKLNNRNEFEVILLFFCLLVFFMSFTINIRTKKIEKEHANKTIFKIRSSFLDVKKKQEQQLKQHNSNLLDLISDGLIFFDPNTHTIDHLNRKAVELLSPFFPLTIDEIKWTIFQNINPSSFKKSLEISLSSLVDNHCILSLKNIAVISAESYEISVHTISSASSLIKIIKAPTNIKRSENNLKMLSYVAHEFRTPLNCINTMLHALIRKAPENLQDAYIIPARDSLDCLLALVNDLLDMSQIMAGKFFLSLSDFKLKNVIKDAIKLMSLQAELKGIKLIYEEIGEIPNEIYSDPARLRQVLTNLMSNSMKYTSQGWIKLQVSVLRPNLFQISVSDTGLGIRKEDQDKLLVDFGRLSHSEDQSLNNYGIGLGLSISDTLSKELSGEGKGLNLESEWGKGSTFSFFVKDFNETDCRFGEVSSLPSIPHFAHFRNLEENVVQSATQSVRTTRTPTTIKRPRTSLDVISTNMFLAENDIIFKKKCDCVPVLICDDNLFNIISLKLQLQNIGKNCDFVSLGEMAINKVKEKLNSNCCRFYKLIFMDLEMPVMDGCETSKKIKELIDNYSNYTKIIAFSGYDDFEERKRALKAGMEEFLVKPVMERDLRRIVNGEKEKRKIRSEQDARAGWKEGKIANSLTDNKNIS